MRKGGERGGEGCGGEGDGWEGGSGGVGTCERDLLLVVACARDAAPAGHLEEGCGHHRPASPRRSSARLERRWQAAHTLLASRAAR